MKKILLLLLVSVSLFANERIKKIAEFQYPNDAKMQKFEYDKQLKAYNFMINNAKDQEVKTNVEFQYPNDYSMQKFTYEKEVSAKNYMKIVNDQEIKNIVTSKYANDYSMQKYI